MNPPNTNMLIMLVSVITVVVVVVLFGVGGWGVVLGVWCGGLVFLLGVWGVFMKNKTPKESLIQSCLCTKQSHYKSYN